MFMYKYMYSCNCITVEGEGWVASEQFIPALKIFYLLGDMKPSLYLEYLRCMSLCISSELPSSSNGSASKENCGVTPCVFEVYA